MRLITWNCKGAFHRKHDFVAALRPDILIVPECEKVSGVTQPFNSAPVESFEWFGSNPRKGLAVISYSDYALEVHPATIPVSNGLFHCPSQARWRLSFLQFGLCPSADMPADTLVRC